MAGSTPFLAPYKFRPAAEIPRREWLYGRHYIRGFVTTTIAPGGAGKSALAIAEALSMATGRSLLGIKPNGRYRVGYWNGEDPLEETERRIAAAIKQYGLDGADLEDWLFVGSGRDSGLTIAKQTRDGAIICPDVERVKAYVAEHALDVLIIDPLVSSHLVPENDNGAINQVAKAWAGIAEDRNIAMELSHHTRKGSGPGHEVTVEDGRGAGALLAAARSARVLNPMTQEEAAKSGVENRRSFFKVENGKSNLAPSSDEASWYQFVGVDLGNGMDGDLEGDNVGVVTPWKWPNHLEGVNAADILRVQEAVNAGRWRANIQARDWVGHAVAKALGLDIGSADQTVHNGKQRTARAKIKGLLKTWLANGVLATKTENDHGRRLRPFVVVGKNPGAVAVE